VGDVDGDGRQDLVMGTIGAGYVLLANETTTGHRVVVDVRGDGRRLAAEPVGTTVSVTDDAGRTQTRTVQVTADDRALTFGLGDARVARIEVRWADGVVEVLDGDGTDQRVTVTAAAFAAFPAAVDVAPLG
jgi:hypothetical protein